MRQEPKIRVMKDKMIYSLLVVCLIVMGMALVYGAIQLGVLFLSEMLFHPLRTLVIVGVISLFAYSIQLFFKK